MEQAPQIHPSNQYAQVKVSIRSELATAFKATCVANDVSMVGVISKFIESYTDTNAPKKGYSPHLSTKRQRRAAIRRILEQLICIRDNEENYRDNIPINLQGSAAFEVADSCISLLDEAIEALETTY